jgi:hypothetical protein
MPTMLAEEPLGLACVFSDGSRAEFPLAHLPCPRLARDLGRGLVELIHPHGTVDAAGTVREYVQALENMVRTLGGRGFGGGAAELRRPQLAEYWMGTTMRREACTRRMLVGFTRAGGVLAGGAAELAAGRAYHPQPYRRVLPPYGEAEWARLTATCRALADGAFAAHRQALASAAGGQHPDTGGWSGQNLRWLLARTGPVGTAQFAEYAGISTPAAQLHGFPQACQDLFPHLDVLVAYRLLFGIYSGIVPDGIDDLGVADADWAGDATVLLSYVKGRTAAESLTLPRRAARLLEQWLAHSALLRSFAPEQARGQLWLGLSAPGGAGLAVGAVGRAVIRRWVLRHGVTGDDGHPLKIHRARIRTTHASLRDKSAWAGNGRAAIDPNHTPHVEGDHYLTATTPAQRDAVEAVVEDAQHDLLRRARPPTVVTGEDAAALAEGYPRLVAGLGLDHGALAELVGGARDVFTAACGDQLSGLHGPKGKPCPARPWVCLLCPLAVFAPRHAANLLRLKAFFARQWQAMPAAQFMAVFGPYAQRIGEVLGRFDPAVLAEAAAGVGDHDGELPLRPEERTA